MGLMDPDEAANCGMAGGTMFSGGMQQNLVRVQIAHRGKPQAAQFDLFVDMFFGGRYFQPQIGRGTP